MTTIAVFSDIHGNLAALEAVYADAIQHGSGAYWFLGDLFGPGPDVQPSTRRSKSGATGKISWSPHGQVKIVYLPRKRKLKLIF